MSRKLKIYLDTSVPNAYFDERNLQRLEITKIFWEKLDLHQTFISDLVLDEIEAIGNEKLRTNLIKLLRGVQVLPSKNEETSQLATEYVNRGIIPAKYIADAVHLAVATTHSLDILVSWNFEHIVKLKTK